MFKYLLAAATAWVILENIEEAITHGYIKVEYEERITNNGEYDTIILRFDNTVKYDYDGYDELTDKEISDCFTQSLIYRRLRG